MDRDHALRREMKAMSATLSSVGKDGLFEGYACLFDKEDLGHDLIRPGAFSKSLKQRGQQGIKLLYQHDPAQPIGQWLSIREDAKGLFVRGQLALDVEKAREIHSMMKAGILDGLSIGFRTVRGHSDKKAGVRYLVELDLWEISIVTFPMQPDARISSIKAEGGRRAVTPAFNPPFSKRELERKLMHDAGLTRSQARGLLTRGFSGLTGMQDAASSRPIHPLTSLHRLTNTLHQATRTLGSGT
ncbi:HK97 family phage prohead protease [Cohaesibacter celericrescens]|uniref:HK97 family phage prohead protease n=1 Tax=Cohaesibacter celericrescens TaxID=2067669 RepID=A0A2N5XR30_9HYPH|nr:HK97 family phage prohead protease [Cohaesibacter celericrescens]PLW76963.1 HK97 family phage prohead protease [Cohaesibacter celericrescens]